MRRAIEVSARTMKEAPHAKRLLFSLSKGLNRGSTDVETARLLEEFRLSLQTSWGNILAANLWFALTTGTEITAALQDLADTEKYLKIIEERNREIEKEKMEGRPEYEQEKREEKAKYANRQTDIKINQEYLDKKGLSVPEELF